MYKITQEFSHEELAPNRGHQTNECQLFIRRFECQLKTHSKKEVEIFSRLWFSQVGLYVGSPWNIIIGGISEITPLSCSPLNEQMESWKSRLGEESHVSQCSDVAEVRQEENFRPLMTCSVSKSPAALATPCFMPHTTRASHCYGLCSTLTVSFTP